MALTVLFVLLAVLLIIGVPVAVSLAVASLVYIMIDGLPEVVLVHNMINGIDSFPLLAIPFFILAGHLMNTAGITTKIFAFARALVGWMHGGLGHVNVGASIIFAGMSGAAVADAGGLGNVEIKAMRDAGYDTDFSVGITAASSTIGPIIPPSLPLVIFGVMASASIGELFAAGLIPGLLMALSLMIMVAIYSRRRSYPRDAAFDSRRLWVTFRGAFFPLLTPVIVVGESSPAPFTPTEAAVAAVAYALFLGARDLPEPELATPRSRLHRHDRNLRRNPDDRGGGDDLRLDPDRQPGRDPAGRLAAEPDREQVRPRADHHGDRAADRDVHGDDRRHHDPGSRPASRSPARWASTRFIWGSS